MSQKGIRCIPLAMNGTKRPDPHVFKSVRKNHANHKLGQLLGIP